MEVMVLEGKFDRTLLNAAALQPILREILANQLLNYGEIRVIDACQQLLDNLVTLGILR